MDYLHQAALKVGAETNTTRAGILARMKDDLSFRLAMTQALIELSREVAPTAPAGKSFEESFKAIFCGPA